MAPTRTAPDRGQVPPKKLYRRPAILSRETLEAVAGVCTPSPPAKADSLSCPLGPLSS